MATKKTATTTKSRKGKPTPTKDRNKKATKKRSTFPEAENPRWLAIRTAFADAVAREQETMGVTAPIDWRAWRVLENAYMVTAAMLNEEQWERDQRYILDKVRKAAAKAVRRRSSSGSNRVTAGKLVVAIDEVVVAARERNNCPGEDPAGEDCRGYVGPESIRFK